MTVLNIAESLHRLTARTKF